jgi:breast cancer metastasis-suppressor 1-like protein
MQSFVFQSEKALLYDQVKEELEDKIRKLEEDRHNVDISSGMRP